MKTWKNIVLITFCAFALGCGDNSDGFSLGSTDPDTDNDSTGSAAPLSLTLLSNLRGSETYVTEGTCEATATTPHATCTISIEELNLYYSNLKFNIATGSRSYCEQVVFRPFRYERSNAAAFSQAGSSSPLDCTKASFERDSKCWGGLAPVIATGFPVNMSNYFLTENTLSASYTAKSADERRESDPDASLMYTNANSTNNLALAARGTGLEVALGDDVDYVANTYVDNFIGCYDYWGNLDYSITLTIRDEDETGPGTVPDEFWDWFD